MIPEGASDAFDPYGQGGSYSCVAKVKPDELTCRDGALVLTGWPTPLGILATKTLLNGDGVRKSLII